MPHAAADVPLRSRLIGDRPHIRTRGENRDLEKWAGHPWLRPPIVDRPRSECISLRLSG